MSTAYNPRNLPVKWCIDPLIKYWIMRHIYAWLWNTRI